MAVDSVNGDAAARIPPRRRRPVHRRYDPDPSVRTVWQANHADRRLETVHDMAKVAGEAMSKVDHQVAGALGDAAAPLGDVMAPFTDVAAPLIESVAPLAEAAGHFGELIAAIAAALLHL